MRKLLFLLAAILLAACGESPTAPPADTIIGRDSAIAGPFLPVP